MSATNTTGPSVPASVPSRRRAMVLAMITLVAVLFLLLFAILWYRSWWRQPVTPSARLVVVGGEEHEGLLVRIEGKQLEHPRETTLRKEDDYIAAFSLPSGTYSIRITRDGRRYFEQRAFHLHEYHLVHVSLKRIDELLAKAAATRPS